MGNRLQFKYFRTEGWSTLSKFIICKNNLLENSSRLQSFLNIPDSLKITWFVERSSIKQKCYTIRIKTSIKHIFSQISILSRKFRKKTWKKTVTVFILCNCNLINFYCKFNKRMNWMMSFFCVHISNKLNSAFHPWRKSTRWSQTET